MFEQRRRSSRSSHRLFGGSSRLDVAGVSEYQLALFDLVGRRVEGRVSVPVVAMLVPEPDEVIAVYAMGESNEPMKVGWIGADDAAEISSVVSAHNAEGTDVALRGTIDGYWDRRRGLGGLRLWLMYDPDDFRMR